VWKGKNVAFGVQAKRANRNGENHNQQNIKTKTCPNAPYVNGYNFLYSEKINRGEWD
jgi:hypothetical protein